MVMNQSSHGPTERTWIESMILRSIVFLIFFKFFSSHFLLLYFSVEKTHLLVLIIMAGVGMCVMVLALLVICVSHLGDTKGPPSMDSC